MIYRVLVQPSAFDDIESTYRWICDNQNPDAANSWYYNLQDALASLEKFPNRCVLAPESKILGRDIRQLLVGKQKNYRVLFIVEEETVAILHVRHIRQARLDSESL